MNDTDYRSKLYDVFATPDRSFDDQVEEALTLGAEYMDLPIAFLTRIDEGIQSIELALGDHPEIQPGGSCPLDRAYCRRTIEMDSPLAVQDTAGSPEISEVAIDTFGLGAYIGAKVESSGETFGTVCFSATDRREMSFTDAEEHFVELLAKLVGQAMERREYRQELDKRETVLGERQEIYRAVIDASFDLVFRINPQGEFTYLSPAVKSLTGADPEAYLGESFESMLQGEKTVEQATQLFDRVMSGQLVEEYYFPLKHRAGDSVLVDLRVVPIYDSQVSPDDRTTEDIIGVQGMARSASERRRRERSIRVLNRVLRHNLRNGMNVISGYSDILMNRLSGEDAQFASYIVEKSNHLIRLSETARQFEQTISTSGETEILDLVSLVEECVEGVGDEYPAATITVETPSTLRAQTARNLEVALKELLRNGAKHSGENPLIRVECEREKEQAVVRISDNGPGLPEEERAVLESGEETPLVHGSGLGLWLVYYIVESHNAELVLRDTDVGTCVEIRLRFGGED